MSEDTPDRSSPFGPFPPTSKETPDASPVFDEAGNAIITMLQKAAEMAKDDSARAMDHVHRLSFQLHAAEERMREAEAEAVRFRDRATKAEAWLLRIRGEIDETFFHRKEAEPRAAPPPAPPPPPPPMPPGPARRPDPYAPPYARGGRRDGDNGKDKK
jgi:hypothetical protein